ncbi:MAG: hypothetical protein MZW92_18245 [Comamonadaceae bacterium]|nr:hypothetical protein [Comamonadaceae bacterium]
MIQRRPAARRPADRRRPERDHGLPERRPVPAAGACACCASARTPAPSTPRWLNVSYFYNRDVKESVERLQADDRTGADLRPRHASAAGS